MKLLSTKILAVLATTLFAGVAVVKAEGDDCTSIVDLVCASDSGFETLCQLLVDLALVDPLLGLAPATVFAPTDAAFEAASGIIETLTNDQIATVVLTHVFDGVLFEKDLVCGKEYQMASGLPTTHICEDDDIFQLGDANFELGRDTWPEITSTNIEVCEGIVHVVNNVIIPVLDGDDGDKDDGDKDDGDKDDGDKDEDESPVESPVSSPHSASYEGPPECEYPYEEYFCHEYGHCISNKDHCPSGDDSPVHSPVYSPVYSPVHAPYYEPPENKCDGNTIADIACSTSSFSTLCAAVTATDLAGTLADPDAKLTVFAPTNGAFRRLVKVLTGESGEPIEVLPELVGLDGVRDILLYHVVGETVFAADLPCPDGLILTVLGQKNQVHCSDDKIEIFGPGNDGVGVFPEIIATDIEACNGVIHVLDFVILLDENGEGF